LIDSRAKGREILEQSWLFGESVSPPVQNRIADSMVLHEHETGDVLNNLREDAVCVVESGKIEQVRGGKITDVIGPRNFFGEERVLFGSKDEYSYRVVEPCKIYEIPQSVIMDVPIVMWKMLESFEFRKSAQTR
jgi:hemerythrin